MHWSWENNRKLRPGQAPRSRTLRATRGPPPSGSLIINETWGWDRRPWLNTKRERAGQEGVLREREKALNPALATALAFTVCSKGSRHNNLYNLVTIEGSWSDRFWFKTQERWQKKRKSRVEKEGGKWRCPVGERKSSSWNEKQHESLLAVSHEILPSPNFYSTKRALALEVLTLRPPLRARPDERVAKEGLGGLALNPFPSGQIWKKIAWYNMILYNE